MWKRAMGSVQAGAVVLRLGRGGSVYAPLPLPSPSHIFVTFVCSIDISKF